LDGVNSFPFVWIGNPNSLLINGKGIAPECQPNGTSFNNSLLCLDTCQGDPLALLATVNVTEGQTYRLRIINSGQLVLMNFAIAGHNLTIVQVEGTNVEPVPVNSLDIAPGQRYDVLVTADQPASSYMIETTIRAREIPDVKGRAVFHYEGAEVSLPDAAPLHPNWNDTAFGIAQDLALKTLNVTKYPHASALNATELTRYVLVGTQNRKCSRVVTFTD
jgi:FtsP/CotA-like multicopper oxidase with cupredoxin domain